MLSTGCIAHLEYDVLKTCSLACRPMYASNRSTSWKACHVDYEVSDLSVKGIGANKPQEPAVIIGVTIYDAYASRRSIEIRRGFENG